MIEVREVTKRYGSTVAVDGLSFDVREGEVTGFLGPNGAGKSTTMRMMVGLDAPTSGRVIIDGHRYQDCGSRCTTSVHSWRPRPANGSRPRQHGMRSHRARAFKRWAESLANVAAIVETMPDPLSALRSSVDRLAGVVRPLDDVAVAGRAYPSEWTIAEVLSHLGSGAVIAQRRLDDALTGSPTPDDFNPGVWDEWNAKSPRTKVDDGLAADGAFVARLEAVITGERHRFKTTMGPLEFNWDAFVGMRLNEHLLHEWDVTVSVDPAATLAADGTVLVVDNLELIGRFTAKPNGDPGTITVGTTDPDRSFAVTIEPGTVTLAPAASAGQPDLSMPAESFIRLVYGRLDPDHTPRSVAGEPAALHLLRAVFPGP